MKIIHFLFSHPILLSLYLILSISSNVAAQKLIGDLNNNGKLEVADLTMIVNMIQNNTIKYENECSINCISNVWESVDKSNCIIEIKKDSTYMISVIKDNKKYKNSGTFILYGNNIHFLSNQCGLTNAVFFDEHIYLSSFIAQIDNSDTEDFISMMPIVMTKQDDSQIDGTITPMPWE